MRMNEYQWSLVSDSRDKKITARSARAARTHCGKSGAVKLPSDYLTKKELKAMSGECIKYASLKEPMSWEEFKALPDDLKKEYIKSIRERFGAPDKYIADMLGVSGQCFGLYVRDLGLGLGKDAGANRKWEKEQFYAWRSGADENAEVAPVAVSETPEAPETDTASSILSDTATEGSSREKILAVPYDGQLTFTCPADQALNMIGMILGNKNVTLSVTWRVIEDDAEEV